MPSSRGGADTARRPVPPSRGRGVRSTCQAPGVDAQFLAIIGTVPAVGFGLAGLVILTMARLDRRIDNDKAAVDAGRRAFQARFDTVMQRLAERLSHVEGRVDGHGAAAD